MGKDLYYIVVTLRPCYCVTWLFLSLLTALGGNDSDSEYLTEEEYSTDGELKIKLPENLKIHSSTCKISCAVICLHLLTREVTPAFAAKYHIR